MIRRLVLDFLKPYSPSVVELSEALSELEDVDGLNIMNAFDGATTILGIWEAPLWPESRTNFG